MIPLCYVAGPFRGKTAWDVAQNVRSAEIVGLEVAKLGGMPVIPHANTAHFDGELSDDFWLKGTLALMERCDALVLAPGWARSTGAQAEYERFIEMSGLSRIFDFSASIVRERDHFRTFVDAFKQ